MNIWGKMSVYEGFVKIRSQLAALCELQLFSKQLNAVPDLGTAAMTLSKIVLGMVLFGEGN